MRIINPITNQIVPGLTRSNDNGMSINHVDEAKYNQYKRRQHIIKEQATRINKLEQEVKKLQEAITRIENG